MNLIKKNLIINLMILLFCFGTGCSNNIENMEKINGSVSISASDSRQIAEIQNTINDKIKIGDKIEFGQYYNDGCTNSGIEPINWIVLDIIDGKALLVTEKIIDCKNIDDGREITTYKDSTLREWFNKYFYINYFTQYEREAMYEYTISEGNELYNDKIFIMNLDECNKYFGNMDERGMNEKSVAVATDWAKMKGTEVSTNFHKDYFLGASYWLRERNNSSGLFMWVGEYGHIYEEGQKAKLNNGDGIRPCVLIDADKFIRNNTIKFGYYEQDNNTENGKEEIEWIILDNSNDELLLLSKNIIEYYNFGDYTNQYKDKYSINDVSNDEIILTHYNNSSLRTFVSEEIYNNAFTYFQKSFIKEHKYRAFVSKEYDYKNNDYITNYDYFTDKCIIPGLDEFYKYFVLYNVSVENDIDKYFKEGHLVGGLDVNDARVYAKATLYAKSKIINGEKLEENNFANMSSLKLGTSRYWLRDTSDECKDCQMVAGWSPSITLCEYMLSYRNSSGVRPLIVLDLSMINNIKINETQLQPLNENRQRFLKSKKNLSNFAKSRISLNEYDFATQLEVLIEEDSLYIADEYAYYIDMKNNIANILATDYFNRKKLYMLTVKFKTQWDEQAEIPFDAKIISKKQLTDDDGNEIIDEDYDDYVYENDYKKILFYLTNPKALHSFIHLPLTIDIKNKYKDIEINGILPDDNYDICISSNYLNDKYNLNEETKDYEYEYYYRDALNNEKTKRYKISYRLDNDFVRLESYIEIIDVELIKEFNSICKVEDVIKEYWKEEYDFY